MHSPDKDKPMFLTLMTRTLLVVALSTVALPQSGQAKPSTSTASNAARPEAKPTGVAVDEAFQIGPDDVLGVDVWKEAEVTRTVTVRSDGKISLPLIGELQASGKTPQQLQEDIRSKLAGFIADPEVTLVVQEIRSHRFNILGQVQHPGTFPLGSSTTVLDAIAEAGGFRDFAKQKGIYVLRTNRDGSQVRIPFNYREVIRGDAKQNVRLENHDTVIVP